nr:putative reverse transcriptase domain-containing protein [Tanacetum cinerariifolium]
MHRKHNLKTWKTKNNGQEIGLLGLLLADKGILSDLGADFSFISTDFVSLLNVKPSTLRPTYVIEVANSKKVETNRIIHRFILDLRNYLITIDLISSGHGSFDVFVGMDWLSKHEAEIVCHEKVVRIPLASSEVLRVQGEQTLGNPKSLKSTKLDEQKLEDIPIIQDFPEVFLEDLSGLPPQRQVKFRIDFVSRKFSEVLVIQCSRALYNLRELS